MRALVGLLCMVAMAGFCVCFSGAAFNNDTIAMIGFLMIPLGMFGGLTCIIVEEMFG